MFFSKINLVLINYFRNPRFSFVISLFIALLSFYLGVQYSYYHYDIHHWSFILEPAINFIKGYSLYDQIPLQYGQGQVILFKFINTIYKIDYVSIGIVTSLFFSLSLLIFYNISRYLLGPLDSVLLLILLFLIHPYPQVPWPDYYSGFFLLAFFYAYIKLKNNSFNSFVVLPLLLFLSIFFRNTYLVNVLLSIILFIFFNKLFLKKLINRQLINIFISLILIILCYCIYLLFYNKFIISFSQGSEKYLNFYEDKNKLIFFIYIFLKQIYYLFVPKNIFYFFINFFYIVTLVYLLFLSKVKNNIFVQKDYKFIYAIFLSLAGIFQTIFKYDAFRLICASYINFILGFYILNYFIKNKISNFAYLFKVVLFLFSYILLISYFPKGSNYFPIIPDKNKKGYIVSDISFFGGHKFSLETIIYYKRLEKLVCSDFKNLQIINYSFDRNILFLCDNAKDYYFIDYFFPSSNKILEFINKKIDLDNYIIISEIYLNNNEKINLLEVINVPRFTRYSYSDSEMKFLNNELYIYLIKKN